MIRMGVHDRKNTQKVTITIKYNHIINMLYLNLLITTLTFDHYHDHAFLKANPLLLTKIYQIL